MNKFVVIDLETTGHSPLKSDKIIEVGLVVIENNEITDTRTTLFNPKMPIPSFISNLTGISDSDVEDAPLFHEKADKIVDIFKDSYLIAHNVKFDLNFLNTELAANGRERLINPVLDTVELSRILFPQAPSYKLGQLAEYLDIHHDDPHRALSDAYVTAKLFLKLMNKLESLPYETIAHLLNLEKLFISDLHEILSNQMDRLAFATTSPKDITIYQGLAFKEIPETKKETAVVKESYGEYLDGIYEANGSMEKQMKGYEKRAGQREMSEIIFDSFRSNTHALIEAETGTGKSLAYLLPAIYEAVKLNQRLIISTYTTQLQSQLLDEEIPALRSLTTFPFQVAILKGKSHYISLEKFAYELNDSSYDNYDIALTKAMLLIWLTETDTGDIDEIQLPSSGYFFYNKISTDAEGKVDSFSPWFSKSFYQKARRKAQKADVVITNHALLCTDMFNDYQFLPTYEKVIIDEAHHFEETASHHYGMKLDYINMQFIFNQIGRVNDGKLFGKLVTNYSLTEVQVPLEKWDRLFDQAKYEIDDLFQNLYNYVVSQHKNSKSLSDIGRLQYRFDEEKEAEKTWDAIQEMVTRLTFFIRDLIHILALIEQHLTKSELMDKYDKEELDGITSTFQNFIDRLEQLFFTEGNVPHVKWIEIDTKGTKNAVYLYSEPAEVSELLANEFFRVKKSVIMTSATLTMKSSFDYIQKRLGLSTDRLITKKIESPFSYKDQVQLLVPNDFPDIKYGNIDDFIYATCEAILSLAEITEGRMLVLFTSYDMLKKSYTLLKETIDTGKYVLIGQGITSGSRSRLKKNFQTFDHAILLGTSSFWEGVDIPGDDLSCLMIVRLPFQPPNHPVFEAKSNLVKEDGKNAFMDLSLPNAVIKFKQGFGRLIRSSSDRGIVFICDARIIKTRYGKYFTESIPNVPIAFDTTQSLIEKAEEWF
ncbi:ATP-dependent DNA helicase DinG [Oceanobacillus polygoni]|uniref:3'-5' exonuclease DinG n=1 Tax=Oceanobacillus polygoni TaxID=1235259 RepID=A0A9X0YT80_9BACI|nr:ATP-dependent DNA helicase DinG [Oceanobacillus polygoni]MBP2078303.1 ATP-dependent DNA helicase DinG [Oceanobacillus polygoni]